jgi:hypothetical protein
MTSDPTKGDELVALLDGSLPDDAEWDEREAALLDLARRQANDIDQLERLLAMEGATVIGSTGQSRLNPVFAELRQQRLALSRILGDIKLPDEGMGISKNVTKSRAALVRWDRVKREREAI